MARKAPRRVKSLEKLSALWVLLLTFILGLVLALLVPHYSAWLPPALVGLLYLFLEFLPLLLFIFTITQPTLRWRISVGLSMVDIQGPTKIDLLFRISVSYVSVTTITIAVVKHSNT